jgi:hypothetical protein
LTSGTPDQLLAEIAGRDRTVPDQWQVQIQARIQSTSRVVMHTSYLSDAELAAAHLEQTADITGTVERALRSAGGDARLCVLPEGPPSPTSPTGPSNLRTHPRSRRRRVLRGVLNKDRTLDLAKDVATTPLAVGPMPTTT